MISTRTKLLQDQLLGKDIPAAAAMLGYPELRALSIKGRANYVCARRLEQVLAEGREPSIFAQDRFAYAALLACARTRRWGEVGTLPAALLFRYPPLRDLLRRSVAARAELCSREQCASERSCPFGRRRAALAQAHLVVANHDLLLRWPPDYPDFTFAFVDEAHELAAVADEVFAAEVRPAEVLERLDELFGRPAGGRDGDALLPKGRRRAAERDARAWRRGVQQDFVALGRSLAARAGEMGELHLPLHAEQMLPDETELAAQAAQRLESAAQAADELPADEAAESPRAVAVARASAELRADAAALRGAFAAGERGGGRRASSSSIRRSTAGGSSCARSRRRALPRALRRTARGTRLRVGEPVRRGRRLRGARRARARGAQRRPTRCASRSRARSRTPSTCAWWRSSPAASSSRRRPGRWRTLARLLGGRTLGLFTSLRRMRDVAELLGEKLRGEGFDVLAPRRATDDPAALVERFARSGGSAARRAHLLAGPRHPGPGAPGRGDREASLRGADGAAQAPRGAHASEPGTTPSSATRSARCC